MPAERPAPRLRGLLFDKDGTLFSFQATWGVWTAELISALAPGAPARQSALADAIAFDAETRTFRPESPIIAGTADDLLRVWLPLLPDYSYPDLMRLAVTEAAGLRPVEAVPLAPLLHRLRSAGLALGVATNDAEEAARGQLDSVGVHAAFTFLAGADSGHGAKPEPGQCLAFAQASGLAPGEIAMIGDSTHDLAAGRAAGMVCVAVLTGVAGADDLSPHADIVLPDIGHLPDWLGL